MLIAQATWKLKCTISRYTLKRLHLNVQRSNICWSSSKTIGWIQIHTCICIILNWNAYCHMIIWLICSLIWTLCWTLMNSSWEANLTVKSWRQVWTSPQFGQPKIAILRLNSLFAVTRRKLWIWETIINISLTSLVCGLSTWTYHLSDSTATLYSWDQSWKRLDQRL